MCILDDLLFRRKKMRVLLILALQISLHFLTLSYQLSWPQSQWKQINWLKASVTTMLKTPRKGINESLWIQNLLWIWFLNKNRSRQMSEPLLVIQPITALTYKARVFSIKQQIPLKSQRSLQIPNFNFKKNIRSLRLYDVTHRISRRWLHHLPTNSCNLMQSSELRIENNSYQLISQQERWIETESA